MPNFVAALNSGGAAFLVQASIKGSAAFLSNDDMATSFVSAGEAEAVYNESFADPDAVMRRLVLGRDRAAYLTAMADMVVKSAELESEAALVVHVQGRDSPDPVLCLVQMRAVFSVDGDSVIFGTKLIPMPSSDCLTVRGPSQPFQVWQRATAEEAPFDLHAPFLGEASETNSEAEEVKIEVKRYQQPPLQMFEGPSVPFSFSGFTAKRKAAAADSADFSAMNGRTGKSVCGDNTKKTLCSDPSNHPGKFENSALLSTSPSAVPDLLFDVGAFEGIIEGL